MINSADVVWDIQFGDCGKGKVSSHLAARVKNKDKDKALLFPAKYYDYVVRWGGGANAGHTVFVKSKKYKTHMVPSGVFHGITSLIGPGCVVSLEGLKEEFSYLKESGFDPSLIKISPAAHIVTQEHLDYDKENLAKKLGTTSKGIAPAYSAKYARTGLQFAKIAEKDPFWEKHLHDGKLSGNILCEGAQGFYLDINWGNYPYITSSETLPYAACSVGFPPNKIKDIYAVAKIYETRSGEDPLFPETLFDNPELLAIVEAGSEYGTTTGRRRKANYLNLDRLINAINIGGANYLVISKCDVLEKVGVFKLFYEDKLLTFKNMNGMQHFIRNILYLKIKGLYRIYFSSSPEKVEDLK